MRQKKKALVALVLVLGVGVTWAPQIVGANASDRLPERPDRPAFGGLGGQPGATGAVASNGANGVSPNASPATAPARATAEQVESTLFSSANHGRAAGAPSLQALLASLDGRSVPVEEPRATDAHQGEAVRRDAELLAAFAADRELTAVLGGDAPLALFGHRVVRAGDALQAGAIAVMSVGAEGIVLRRGDARLRVGLASLDARASTPVERASREPRRAPGAAPRLGDDTPVALELRGVPVAEAFWLIATRAGVNAYLDASLDTPVDASFPAITLDGALQVILTRNRLRLVEAPAGVFWIEPAAMEVSPR